MKRGRGVKGWGQGDGGQGGEGGLRVILRGGNGVNLSNITV